jgi:hypothetical protein
MPKCGINDYKNNYVIKSNLLFMLLVNWLLYCMYISNYLHEFLIFHVDTCQNLYFTMDKPQAKIHETSIMM